MKITVICGDDEKAAFRRIDLILKGIKKRDWEIVFLEKSGLMLSEKMTGGSLFSEDRLFVCRNFSELSTADLTWLSKHGSSLDGNLLIYKKGEFPKKSADLLGKNVKIEKFDLPKSIFVFLDAFVPKNSSRCMELFHQSISKDPVELVFAMLCSHLRDLYWVSVSPQTFKSPSWRAQKLSRQAKLFDVQNIKKIINKLSEIDIKAKTSKVKLAESIDLLIISELK